MSGKDARRFFLSSSRAWSCLIYRFMLVLFVSDLRPSSLLFLRPRYHVLRPSKICCLSSNDNFFNSLIFQYFLERSLRCTTKISNDSKTPSTYSSSISTDDILQVDHTSGRKLEGWITSASKYISISIMLVFTVIFSIFISSLDALIPSVS